MFSSAMCFFHGIKLFRNPSSSPTNKLDSSELFSLFYSHPELCFLLENILSTQGQFIEKYKQLKNVLMSETVSSLSYDQRASTDFDQRS